MIKRQTSPPNNIKAPISAMSLFVEANIDLVLLAELPSRTRFENQLLHKRIFGIKLLILEDKRLFKKAVDFTFYFIIQKLKYLLNRKLSKINFQKFAKNHWNQSPESVS